MGKEFEQLRLALLAANDQQGAAMVADPSTEITVHPTRFLKRYRIYRVLYYSPYKPILLYLAFAPGAPLYSLAGNPQAYYELAQADGVDLATLDLALNYVTVFLEVTRNMYELVYQVNAVEQIRFLPRLSSEQRRAKLALTEKYQAIITAPNGEVTEEGYVVIAYVVRQQELERHTFKVARNGSMESQRTLIEQNMPVVIGI
jgi:hypothetical protein